MIPIVDVVKFIKGQKYFYKGACSNLESAKDLAEALGRPVVASKGKVSIYENGFIESTQGNKWFEIQPNGSQKNVDAPKGNKSGKSVRLGYTNAKTLAEIKNAIEFGDLRGGLVTTTKGDFYIPGDWERIIIKDGIRYQPKGDNTYGIRLRGLDDRPNLSTTGKPYCRIEHFTDPQFKYDLSGSRNRVTTNIFDDTHFIITEIGYYD